MRRKIIEQIASSNLIQHLSKSTAPHWVVMLCDILIVFFSAFITLMCSGDSAKAMFIEPANVIILRTVAVTAVFAVVFLIVKPYRSIVRLSTTEDIYRIVLSVFIAMIIMVTGESLYQIYFYKPLVGLWNIAVISILSFSLMTITRMAIKSVFSTVTTFNQSRTRVVVLGSAIKSFALASALNSESEGRFRPVLMLSLGKRNLSSSVNGIPILPYDPNNIAEIFEQYHSDTLLFLSTQIEFMRSGGADVFLSNHIRLLMLNQIEEFDVNSDSQPTLSPHVQNIRIEDLLGRETIHNDDPAIALNIRVMRHIKRCYRKFAYLAFFERWNCRCTFSCNDFKCRLRFKCRVNIYSGSHILFDILRMVKVFVAHNHSGNLHDVEIQGFLDFQKRQSGFNYQGFGFIFQNVAIAG